MSVYSPFSLFIAVSSFLNLIIFFLILIYFIAHLHIYNPSVLSFSKSSFGLFITCLRYSLLHTTKCKCTFRNTSTNVFTGSHFQVKRRLSRRLIVPICIAVYMYILWQVIKIILMKCPALRAGTCKGQHWAVIERCVGTPLRWCFDDRLATRAVLILFYSLNAFWNNFMFNNVGTTM